jgi:hypothetical protein
MTPQKLPLRAKPHEARRLYLDLHRIRRQVERDFSQYTDFALTLANGDASSPFVSRRDKKATAEAIA